MRRSHVVTEERSSGVADGSRHWRNLQDPWQVEQLEAQESVLFIEYSAGEAASPAIAPAGKQAHIDWRTRLNVTNAPKTPAEVSIHHNTTPNPKL